MSVGFRPVGTVWETACVTAVIAHRGASAVARENTLDAFRLARELGADWVELDVRRTADGVAVVHHDAHLADGRTIGTIQADELPDYVPSLAEALETCEGMGVHLEIKNLPDDPDYDRENLVADAVVGLIAAYLGPARAVVSSFNVDAADAVRAVDPIIPTALVCGIVQPAAAIDRARAHEMAAVHPFDAMCDAAFVRRAHRFGLAVNVWTINEPDRMAELVAMGVDGLITDVPDTARSVVDAV